MRRVFVTAISLQPPKFLEELCYTPQEFELKNNRPTRFPIVPLIAEFMGRPDLTDIVAILPPGPDAEANYHTFVEEVRSLGINEDQIHVLKGAEKQGTEESMKLFADLLDAIPDDSIVYADITYNTKPMSAMLVYAMSAVERVKDTEVQCICYGEIPRINGVPQKDKAALYDINLFKRLNDLVESLDDLGVTDIRRALSRLMHI